VIGNMGIVTMGNVTMIQHWANVPSAASALKTFSAEQRLPQVQSCGTSYQFCYCYMVQDRA